jgi:hypothetical protein
MRCSRTRKLPDGYKHAEVVVRRERVPDGVAYHCLCMCGERWIIGVAVSDEIADLLADRPWVDVGYWAAARKRFQDLIDARRADDRADLDVESYPGPEHK